MRFPPDLLDEIRARLPVSQVVSRHVKLNRKGREFVGLSPFKQEKTPSFTVNDQKGFYHCFATGEHGDIFKFLIVTEGLSFPEAVERLAEEARVSLPKLEPHQADYEEVRGRLLNALEQACFYFQAQLKGALGREARDYLERRGVTREQQAHFRVGYAPGGRFALKEHLCRAGFKLEELIKSGMVIGGDDIAVPYDRFRNRVIFPISDLRGRVIAFGGRALDAAQPAKYLNSPETPLFHKGSVLFNGANGRRAAREAGTVIVTEGYMDVIALDGAGLSHAVAPLGTALTEDQMRQLWRMAPEPILCFDGDTAGVKAAHRAVETVLPLLQPGHSLRFAFLPEGLDPDDLIRRAGREAMAETLAGAQTLSDVLWNKEWQAGEWTTPELRASLEHRIGGLIQGIAHSGVRAHYHQDMTRRFGRAWSANQARWVNKTQGRSNQWSRGSQHDRAKRRGEANRAGSAGVAPSQSTSLLRSNLVQGSKSLVSSREALMMLTLLNHPWLIDQHAEDIAGLQFESKAMSQLRDQVLGIHAEENPLDRATLAAHLERLGLGKSIGLAERAITHKSDRFSEPNASERDVELAWRHIVSLHKRQFELQRAVRSVDAANASDGTVEALVHLQALHEVLEDTEGQEATIDGYGTDPSVA